MKEVVVDKCMRPVIQESWLKNYVSLIWSYFHMILTLFLMALTASAIDHNRANHRGVLGH